jgi:aldehyde dehydrogenase (NAD+)
MSYDTSADTISDRALQLKRELVRPRLMLIDGQWVAAQSGDTLPTFNPSTGEQLAELQSGDQRDIDIAVAAARRAFEGPWRRTKASERQQLLMRLADLIDRHFDELNLLDTLDMGAPIGHTSQAFKQRALGRILYAVSSALQIKGETIQNGLPGEILSYTIKEPIGVVGAIIPWNGPLGMAIWKLAPALAAGCTIVLKPAEEASLSTLRLGELVCEAGFPSGVVNIVTGHGHLAGAALAAHPDVNKVAFTGSTETGQAIIRASAGNMKRLTLELGGKSPNIVFADADLAQAIPMAAMAGFANTGQACIAGSRLYVHRSIFEEFMQGVAAVGKSLTVGDSLDPNTRIGPLVSEKQLERVTGYMRLGVEEGAQAICGGSRITDGDLAKGYFVSPTVFTGVNDSMRIVREEIFGPVISALPFDTEDEVLEQANASPFGLAAGVWTKDVSRALRMSRHLRAGTVWVNCYMQMDPAVPFGGYKMSGIGREGGMEHLENYLETKAVMIKES